MLTEYAYLLGKEGRLYTITGMCTYDCIYIVCVCLTNWLIYVSMIYVYIMCICCVLWHV